MKQVFPTVFLILCLSFEVKAQNEPIYSTLMSQVEAFNNRDIEKLTSKISDDFKWYSVGGDTLILEVNGKEDFRKSMESYFINIISNDSEIVEFAIHEDRISFRETVKYKNSRGVSGVSSSMGVYQIKNGLIHRAWYFSE